MGCIPTTTGAQPWLAADALRAAKGTAQARAAGSDYCETDWRSANRGVARRLPRFGFRPVGYRLVRRFDARIAWARGSESASTG